MRRLGRYELGPEGGKALAEALKVNTTLALVLVDVDSYVGVDGVGDRVIADIETLLACELGFSDSYATQLRRLACIADTTLSRRS